MGWSFPFWAIMDHDNIYSYKCREQKVGLKVHWCGPEAAEAARPLHIPGAEAASFTNGHSMPRPFSLVILPDKAHQCCWEPLYQWNSWEATSSPAPRLPSPSSLFPPLPFSFFPLIVLGTTTRLLCWGLFIPICQLPGALCLPAPKGL